MTGAVPVVTAAIPPACVKCGSTSAISPKAYQKTYTPVWVYLGLLLGALPMVILMLIGNKTHKLSLSFCPSCWERYHKAQVASRWMLLVFLVMLFGSLFLGIATQSWTVGLGLFVLALVGIIWANRNLDSASPKCVKLGPKTFILDIPGHGNVEVAGATS